MTGNISSRSDSIDVKLLRRAIGEKRRHRSVKTVYGDESWARDLDIVNELGGHTGCVNALSWSTAGNLLASGSDDMYLNIWDYNPVSPSKPFTLNTSVSTGHHANIFSVKFMPHSSDRTVVTCAGDSEVRVFDLEHSRKTIDASNATESTRSRRFNNFFGNAHWLNETNTNARVYRSHADRAKRIVTESSPYLFLTCSEDGEVRQWDLRQPSSAYPPPREGRRSVFRRVVRNDGDGDAPPPLISYKRYGLDLNSISCSGSQPQYIALGGAHLHCFLHDRRMLGRDLSAEQGVPNSSTPDVGSASDEAVREATRCVRRFAPNNKRKMKPRDSGYITACKISDARPNELIASWSGDHIYSFDIVKSPDARDTEIQDNRTFQRRLRNSADRKRKRAKAANSSSSHADGTISGRRLKKVSDEQQEAGHTALRVRYENGETEELSLDPVEGDASRSTRSVQDLLLTDAQKQSQRIAHALVKLRKTIFDFGPVAPTQQAEAPNTTTDVTGYTAAFTDVLGQASALLSEMSEVMRTWSYPVDPDQEEVTLQNTLRRNRQASWRFVQACGCLSRTLGGRLQTSGSDQSPQLAQFDSIKPAIHEGKLISNRSRFCLDFLKAILLWLEGGKVAVLNGFKRPPGFRGDATRFPLEEGDDVKTMPSKLRNYLLAIANDDKPVIDLGTNRFERDELRNVFESQIAAVEAFVRALDSIELRSHQGTSEVIHVSSHGSTKRLMDKGAATRYWGLKVGRSLLMDAAEGINFNFVSRAFGGLKVHILSEAESPERPMADINPEENDPEVEAIDLITSPRRTDTNSLQETSEEVASKTTTTFQASVRDDDHDEERSIVLEEADLEEDNSFDNDSDANYSGSEDESEHDPLFRRQFGLGGFSANKSKVNIDVPYTSHTKTYKGHCNTRTVKDVNYYGLDDEYIVSGSDDGHFFIWNRKTSQVVNILEGDGEVVNVVQGHPYEPMIACSGIDNTVKIFGASGQNNTESRERWRAMQGQDIANPGGSGRHTPWGIGARSRRRRASDDDDDDDDDDSDDDDNDDNEDDTSMATTTDVKTNNGTTEEIVRGGLKSRRALNRMYEIIAQNDSERRRGIGDTFVTQGMLARFAAAMQRGEIQGVLGQGLGGEGGTIVLDDNCSVM